MTSDELTATGFSVEITRVADYAVVRCRGRLVAGVSDSLYDEIRPLIAGSRRIVLDLTDLTNMDSSGLGTVVRLYVSAKSAGCDLQLVNIGKRIRQVFGIANLLSFFTIVGENDIRIP